MGISRQETSFASGQGCCSDSTSALPKIWTVLGLQGMKQSSPPLETAMSR
jgi:hypothetical protein